MSAAFLSADPWVKYLAEMSTGSGGLALNEDNFDFEAGLELTMEEYRVTKERSEILEKKISKMLQLRHAKAHIEYEIAQRNLTLLEKEGDLVRNIIPGVDTGGNKITGMQSYEGRKRLGGLTPPDIDFMNNFSVSLEDHTRDRIDEPTPTRGVVSDHEGAGISRGHSINEVGIDGGLRDLRASEIDPVPLARKDADAGVSEEDRRPGSTDPFSTGKKRTNAWIYSKSPEELREIRAAVEKALKHGVEGDGVHGRTRRRLSKRHRFNSKTGDANIDLFKTLT